MNLTSDYPFWSVQNGLLAEYPSLTEDADCDVVIVGGGITGALVAAHLVASGVDTLLIDRRDIGTGSTSGSTALLQYEVDVPLRELGRKMPPADAARAYQLCVEAIGTLEHLVKRSKIRCDFEPKPSLFLARHRSEVAEFAEEYQLRRNAGIELELWDESALQKHFPFSRPAALFSRHAASVDPHRLTHGLLRVSREKGLRIHDRTKMAKLEETRNGVRLTTDHRCVIRARRAVIATGFEAKILLHGEAGTLRSTYALVSEPMPPASGWYRQCLIWESGDPYLYLRTTPDGRVIVGGEDESFVSAQQRDALIATKARILTQKFGRLFSSTPLEVAYAWAGTFATTRDGLPFIGRHPRFLHAHFALGYGGNGITFSLLAAEIIRDSIVGRSNPNARLFRFGR